MRVRPKIGREKKKMYFQRKHTLHLRQQGQGGNSTTWRIQHPVQSVIHSSALSMLLTAFALIFRVLHVYERERGTRRSRRRGGAATRSRERDFFFRPKNTIATPWAQPRIATTSFFTLLRSGAAPRVSLRSLLRQSKADFGRRRAEGARSPPQKIKKQSRLPLPTAQTEATHKIGGFIEDGTHLEFLSREECRDVDEPWRGMAVVAPGDARKS